MPNIISIGGSGSDGSVFVGTQDMLKALPENEQLELTLWVRTDAGAESDGLAYKSDLVVNEYLYTILATGWVDGKYTIEHSAIKADNKVMITLGYEPTTEQMEALQGANIIEYKKQENGKGYLKAMGDVPTIDIPVRLVV